MYCYDDAKSGQRRDITRFNAACWDNSGKSLSYAYSFRIDWIGLQVPSWSADTTASNLCLTGIEFGGLPGTTVPPTASTSAIATSTAAVRLNKGRPS